MEIGSGRNKGGGGEKKRWDYALRWNAEWQVAGILAEWQVTGIFYQQEWLLSSK